MVYSRSTLNCIILSSFLAGIPAGLWGADGTRGDSNHPLATHAAGDGAVYINQHRALKGGVTAGDVAGFPVTISESGSYRLSGNLVVPDLNTTAIQIAADFVTLDLNGFSIVGPGVCSVTGQITTCPSHGSGIGILAGSDQAPFPRGVRILNGSIRGMGLTGLQLSGLGSSVEKVTVDSNAGGGMSVEGAVIQSAATNNGSFGMIAAVVRDSIVMQNAGDGILFGTNGGVATGNISSFNGGFGIAVQLGTATGNTLFLNQAAGISAMCPSSVVGNTIVTNGHGNITTSGDGCAVTNNALRP